MPRKNARRNPAARVKASDFACSMTGCFNRGAVLIRSGSMTRLGGIYTMAWCAKHAEAWRMGSLEQRRAWRKRDRAPERRRNPGFFDRYTGEHSDRWASTECARGACRACCGCGDCLEWLAGEPSSTRWVCKCNRKLRRNPGPKGAATYAWTHGGAAARWRVEIRWVDSHGWRVTLSDGPGTVEVIDVDEKEDAIETAAYLRAKVNKRLGTHDRWRILRRERVWVM